MEKRFENKSILKLILTMGLPPIISMLIQSLYSIIDAWYVAKISEDAFNAVSIVYPIQSIILSIAVGLGVAINGCIARNLGKRRQDKVEEFSILAVVLGFIHYALVIILSLIVITPFVKFNTTDATFDMARLYISIICFGSIGVIMQLVFEKILQGYGNMIVPTVSQIIGCIINIILDHILVLVLGYGVVGAAVATIIAQAISALIIFVYILFNKQYVLSFKKLRFSKENLIDVYKVCIPSTLMMSLPSILVMGLNYILGTINEIFVTILNLYLKVQTFIFMPVVGLLQGVRPIIGYFYGANQSSKLKEVLKISMIMITGVMIFGVVIFTFMPDLLIKMFFDSEDVINHGSTAFRILSLSFVFVGGSYLFATFYESLGYGVVSLLINLSRQLVITIILTLLFVYAFDFGAKGVWYAMLIAEILTGIFVGIMFKYTCNNTDIFNEKTYV